MKDIKSILKKRIVILDGATATELQKRGMPQGASPESWCLKNADIISAVHKDYKKAGADIVYTCTFGANRIKLKEHGLDNVTKINRQIALIARNAVGGNTIIAGDIGPTGKFIEPFGHLKFEQAVKVYKEQVKGLLSGGVDIFIIETMIDIQEARAALIAVKEITDKFTMVTMTYENSGRTLGGTDPITALVTLQSLGADAVGCNCSAGPRQMMDFIKLMKPYARVPLIAKPNAGIPKLIKGQTIFNMGPKEFASSGREFISWGVNMLGGCCGTTPEHIKQLKRKISDIRPLSRKEKRVSVLSSARKTIFIDSKTPMLIAGECINPTGKKDLKQELRQGKTSIVCELAKKQERNGAGLLDVNVGVSGIDEKDTLRNIIGLLSVISELPLIIDSARPEAIEAALRIYPGRALINSISAEKGKLKKLLSIAAKYGAMFIALALDEKGIPDTFEKRKKIIEYIVSQARPNGFNKEDIIVDGITMTVSSHPEQARETIKTISWCSRIFNINTVIGLSNISFGLPKRSWVNAAYLAMAQAEGLSMVIANPFKEEIINIKKASDVLTGKDKNALSFISHFRESSSPNTGKSFASDMRYEAAELFTAITDGNREGVETIVDEAVKSGIDPRKLVDVMTLAINNVGDLFDKKEYFLPQLIASAEAMKTSFKRLEPFLKKDISAKAKKTVVILATVKGDVHDIGKNIVALMLKNHGFSVIDLGKDISPAKIIEQIKRHKSPIVGLSALMTTTMVNMKEVTTMARKQRLNCRFVVGGAVVTKSYACSIGAEYADNGVDAVRVVKRLR